MPNAHLAKLVLDRLKLGRLRMATEKQLVANRQNALKSSGPRSLDGKRRSSPNALRHGLTSTQMVIPGEDPAEFSEFRLSVNGGVIPGHYGGIEVGQ